MLDVKKTLSKMLLSLSDMKPILLSEQLANSNVMTWTAGMSHGLKLPDGEYLVFFSYGIKTTAQRTDLAVFRICLPNGNILRVINPYFFPCMISGVWRHSYANTYGHWFTGNGQWNANTEIRISGVALMYDTGDHI